MGRYDIRGLSKWRYRELKAVCRQYDEMRRAQKPDRVRMIEEAARQAAQDEAQAILLNVTQDVRYEYCGSRASKSSFYRMRGRFFILLDRALWEKG